MMPQSCVVLEDAPAGVQAGKSAGCKVVAIVAAFPAESLAAADLFGRLVCRGSLAGESVVGSCQGRETALNTISYVPPEFGTGQRASTSRQVDHHGPRRTRGGRARGFKSALIPDIVQRHDAWIRRTLNHIAATRPAEREPVELLPITIHFGLTGDTWQILYQEAAGAPSESIECGSATLLVSGPVHDHAFVRASLRMWIKRQRIPTWPPGLIGLRASTGSIWRRSPYVRKELGGSCSAKKTMSLNLRLMFLPSRLVRYVLLHELAHTEQLNHSPAFWKLLDRLYPGCRG